MHFIVHYIAAQNLTKKIRLSIPWKQPDRIIYAWFRRR